MKKSLSAVLIFTFAFLVLVGCQPTVTPPAGDPTEIRIGGMRGPTSMGMVQLMEAAEAGNTTNAYTFTISGTPDEVTPKLIKGELDIAALPGNLASVLYHNSNKEIKLLAINTLGVVYIVENGDQVQSLADLRGKTIYAAGKGTTPEYTLRYLLTQHGIDPDTDVKLDWRSESTEIVALLAEDKDAVAMLPQPYVTVAQTQLEGLRIAIDLTQAWDELDNGSTLITGVLVVRSAFAEEHPQAVAAFLDEYQASTEYVNTNIPEAAQLIEKYGIFNAAVAQKAIPYCNITYLDGNEMQTAMTGYLGVLLEQNPQAIGGALPDTDFYYAR